MKARATDAEFAAGPHHSPVYDVTRRPWSGSVWTGFDGHVALFCVRQRTLNQPGDPDPDDTRPRTMSVARRSVELCFLSSDLHSTVKVAPQHAAQSRLEQGVMVTLSRTACKSYRHCGRIAGATCRHIDLLYRGLLGSVDVV